MQIFPRRDVDMLGRFFMNRFSLDKPSLLD